VPVTFGLEPADVPTPMQSSHIVRGDIQGEDGIPRLLQQVNEHLGHPLAPGKLRDDTARHVPAFLASVTDVLDRVPVEQRVLASLPSDFPAETLAGYWVTCYRFASTQGQRCHVDLAKIVAQPDRRRIKARNFPPEPRTEGHSDAFRNEVEAELANRHLIGHWKNVSDTRYFGAVHLAVLPGERVMEGFFTSLASDIEVSSAGWKWVRLDLASLAGGDITKVVLRKPADVEAIVLAHGTYDLPLAVETVAEVAR
jgi:hypothetical protein